MTRDEARRLLVATIARVAPGVDAVALPDSADLRRDLDLDSFDVLRLMTELSRAIGRDIPDRDVARLTSLGATVDYVAEAAGSAPPPG